MSNNNGIGSDRIFILQQHAHAVESARAEYRSAQMDSMAAGVGAAIGGTLAALALRADWITVSNIAIALSVLFAAGWLASFRKTKAARERYAAAYREATSYAEGMRMDDNEADYV